MEKLTGTVEHIVYENRDTAFSVLDLDSGGELVTVVGELAGTAVGEELTVYGEYATHPVFGVQFKASAAERLLPSGAAAILKYLSGRVIEGIGPALARRMVDAFGEDTLEVIARQPEKLIAVKGFSKRKAAEVQERFLQIYGLRETLSELARLSLGTHEAIRLYRDFGPHSSEVIRNNPYMLSGYPLYKDFEFSDALAKKLGFSGQDQSRVRAGIVYILRHNMSNGHTCLPAERLIDTAHEFLMIDRDAVEIALWEAVEDRLILSDRIGAGSFIFLPPMLRGESFIADRLALLRSLEYYTPDHIEPEIDAFEEKAGIVYERLQREAIRESLRSGAVVITGGPGTGKTTALNAIIALAEKQGDKVALAAPTGRAAKRMSELTGRDAKTIHRLLEVDYRNGDEDIRFLRNEDNPLPQDVVVIDEMSMVDVPLFESLLRGLRPQCRLIMVGDGNQLPAVGAGNLLRDIIESGAASVIELQKIFRQAAESGIVVGAHSIVAGAVPDLSARDSDFFFLASPERRAGDLIADLLARRLPNSYGVDPFSDIQVLSPQRKGFLGTESLNAALRERLNPKEENKAEVRVMGALFREGDRVMQTRNNYDIEYKKEGEDGGTGVFNGDIGRVLHIARGSAVMVVEFDDRKTVTYSFDAARELEPAFAVTVHKSQGSEFPIVVLALAGVPKQLRYRNLLYTAVTRAKKLLVIVGEEGIVAEMAANDKKSLRFTALRELLARRIG